MSMLGITMAPLNLKSHLRMVRHTLNSILAGLKSSSLHYCLRYLQNPLSGDEHSTSGLSLWAQDSQQTLFNCPQREARFRMDEGHWDQNFSAPKPAHRISIDDKCSSAWHPTTSSDS